MHSFVRNKINEKFIGPAIPSYNKTLSFEARILCVEKKNQLDTTEWFIALIICSTCFGHFCAHHQELEILCVLLPPMVCDALVDGCWRSGVGQQAKRPE